MIVSLHCTLEGSICLTINGYDPSWCHWYQFKPNLVKLDHTHWFVDMMIKLNTMKAVPNDLFYGICFHIPTHSSSSWFVWINLSWTKKWLMPEYIIFWLLLVVSSLWFCSWSTKQPSQYFFSLCNYLSMNLFC